MILATAGNPITIDVALLDQGGAPINAQAITYTVTDEAGNVLIADVQVMPYTSGQASVSITIPASVNALPSIDMNHVLPSATVVRAARVVTVTGHFIGGSTVSFNTTYIVEPSDLLVAGVNSFQNYMQAQINAFDVMPCDHFMSADQRSRSLALIEAATRIRRLRFDFATAMSSAMYRIRGTMNGSLDFVTPANFLQLPDYFIKALRLAQIVEANHILGGDQEHSRRDDGVLLEAAGDAKVMYRAGIKVQTALCREALAYLNRYTRKGMRLGRG